MRLLTVCLGNICRSPTAEAVLRHMATDRGLTLTIDSCGLGPWHQGDPPYAPMIAAAAARGYDLTPLRARQLRPSDFQDFDVLLAMDHDNLAEITARAPAEYSAQLRLFLDTPPHEVPDPYYTREFEGALDLIERGARRLLDQIT